MKEEVEDLNGGVGDELMDDSNPLSIDEQDDTTANNAAGIIRINKGIQNQASSALKRKSEQTNGTGPVIRKSRPSNSENESDISTLEKEVRALHWLARRKEQEWDQVIRLLKQKEERLMQAQRTRTLIRADSEHVLSRALVLPKRNTIMITNPAKRPAGAVASNLNVSEITEDKISNAIQKATENLGKEAVKEKTKTPGCQGCKKRKSEFVCAGCSNRWYCSRECQVEDWDDHADECSG